METILKDKKTKSPVKYNKGCNFNEVHSNNAQSPMKSIKFRELISSQSNDYTICADWLELFCQSEQFCKYISSLRLEEAQPEKIFKISEKYKIRYAGHGTKLYSHMFTLIINQFEFAIIQSNPRKIVGKMTDYAMSIKVLNHHLYTVDYVDTLITALKELEIICLNITRLDIAVDNVNHLYNFMNEYVQQNKQYQDVIYAGKADISFKKMNNFLEFESIQIGSGNSEKHIVIYNKAKELKKANKNYIYDFWQSNLSYINENEVIRCELRLKSKELNSYKNLTLEALKHDHILKEIFTKSTKKLLDFRFNDNKNISRCESISLLDVNPISSQLLKEKITYTQSDTYKAKLSIHQIYKIFCTVKLLDNERAMLELNLQFYLRKYNLTHWYKSRVEYWDSKYGDIYEKY